MEDLKSIIASNLTELRKNNKLTQLELAEKLNYSDKAISKWEHAEALPDITVLYQLSELYSVTLDYLVSNAPQKEKEQFIKKRPDINNQVSITMLGVIMVWMVATVLFIYSLMIPNIGDYFSYPWMAFVWAVPVSCLVLSVFNQIWGKRCFKFYIWSLFTWSLLASFYLQVLSYNLWLVFILGIPIQLALVLWFFIKKPTNKNKK